MDLPSKISVLAMGEKLFCLSQRVGSLSDLININQDVMHHASEENVRNWAYILSVGFFLRQDEAANLVLSDISLARNPSTERPLLTDDGLPHWLL